MQWVPDGAHHGGQVLHEERPQLGPHRAQSLVAAQRGAAHDPHRAGAAVGAPAPGVGDAGGEVLAEPRVAESVERRRLLVLHHVGLGGPHRFLRHQCTIGGALLEVSSHQTSELLHDLELQG